MARNLGFDVNPGGTRLVISQGVSLALAWLVCLLRAHVKLFMIKKVRADDWLMLIALFVYTAYGVIAIRGVAAGGTGKHTEALTPDGIETALRGWYLCEVLYAPLSAVVRTSIALFLLRLAVKPWHIWTIRVTLAMIWLISIIYFFLMTFQCLPPSYFWQGPVRGPEVKGSCMDHNIVPIATVVHSTVSAVSDWVLGLLPIAILWNVSINRRTKVGIAILLGMGFIAGIALIVRIPYIKKIAISADFLFETIDFAIWSVVEPSLGIMAGCIASIRPLFKTWGFGLNRSRRSASRQFQGSDEAGVVQRWRASRKVERLPESGSTGIGAGPDPVQRQPKGSQVLHVSDLELNPVETSSEHLTADRPNASALGSVGYGRKINEGDLAHGRGINVHTSINVVSSWRQDPPRQPRRVYRP